MEWNSEANKDHVYNVSQVLREFTHLRMIDKMSYFITLEGSVVVLV